MDQSRISISFATILETVLTNAFSVLDLPTVVRLASCSKEARTQCAQLLASRQPYWLRRAVIDGDAQAIGGLLQGQADLLHAVGDELLSTPNVTLAVACELITLGLRPGYVQIGAIARQGIPGVYVWAAAYRQLQVPSDVPVQAQALCSGEDMVSYLFN